MKGRLTYRKIIRFAGTFFLLAGILCYVILPVSYALPASRLALVGFVVLLAGTIEIRLIRDMFRYDYQNYEAVLRILFFGLIATGMVLGELPRKIPGGMDPLAPPFAGWMAKLFLPVNERAFTLIKQLTLYASVACVLGLFTRVSALMVAGGMLYFFGLTSMFGKVVHQQMLVWVPVFLAMGSAGRALAIDKYITGSNHKLKKLFTAPLIPALPFIWLLCGVFYFFAGWWKIWDCGLAWITGPTLQNIILLKILAHPQGWMPVLKIYTNPLLCNAGALFTILFELAFVFALFLPSWRWLAFSGGFLFHLMTWLSMGISFIFNMVILLTGIIWSITCRKNVSAEKSVPYTGITRWYVIPLTVIFLFFLAGLFKVHSWPISSAPLFNWIPDTSYPEVVLYSRDASGIREKVNPDSIKEQYGEYNFKYWSDRIIIAWYDKDTLEVNYHINRLVDLISAHHLADSGTLEIWMVNYRLDADCLHNPCPLDSVLIAKVPVQGD